MQKAIGKYALVIFWSEEDLALIAKVPELPGCAANGKTCQEALDNVRVIIIKEWIETAKELGRPIPSTQRPPRDCLRRTSFSVPIVLYGTKNTEKMPCYGGIPSKP